MFDGTHGALGPREDQEAQKFSVLLASLKQMRVLYSLMAKLYDTSEAPDVHGRLQIS